MKSSKFLIALTMLAAVAASGCNRGNDENVIRVEGSDTMLDLANNWREAYNKEHSDLKISVNGEGTGTGVKALAEGEADIANASRHMKDKEIELIKKNRGVDPKEHVVAKDALAIFVSLDNPLNEISIAELAEIFREGGSVNKWSDLKREAVPIPDYEIVVLNRNSSSGTFGYFQKAVLGGKPYRSKAISPGASKDIVDFVAKNKNAIGYAGMAYFLEGKVKMLKIREKEGATAVEPNSANARDGSYPITRPLLCYTAGEPSGIVKEYIDWMMSKPGQVIVKKIGYVPIIEVE